MLKGRSVRFSAVLGLRNIVPVSWDSTCLDTIFPHIRESRIVSQHVQTCYSLYSKIDLQHFLKKVSQKPCDVNTSYFCDQHHKMHPAHQKKRARKMPMTDTELRSAGKVFRLVANTFPSHKGTISRPGYHGEQRSTHTGGFSGRPSDRSFRCLSALVRVVFLMSLSERLSSGCCWMNSRMFSWTSWRFGWSPQGPSKKKKK